MGDSPPVNKRALHLFAYLQTGTSGLAGFATRLAALAPGCVPRCLLQSDSLVSVIEHAETGALVTRKLEANRLNWTPLRIRHRQDVQLSDIESFDLEATAFWPFFRWLLIDSDLEPMRVNLTIRKCRGLFEERGVNPRRNAYRARMLLRYRRRSGDEGENDRYQPCFHCASTKTQ